MTDAPSTALPTELEPFLREQLRAMYRLGREHAALIARQRGAATTDLRDKILAERIAKEIEAFS